jgi:fluoroquinolone resistance protein
VDSKLTENKTFEKIDFTTTSLPKGEYDGCVFNDCNFYEANLANYTFNECEFKGCDFSLAKIHNVVLNDIRFLNCKLLGLHFDTINDFMLSVYFQNCLLKLSTFYKLKLKKTRFNNCNLQDVDFSDTDLSNSIFENCDLQDSIFSNTNLEKVDFSTSFNYSIDPEKNRIKRAKFSRLGLIGLLGKYNIDVE